MTNDKFKGKTLLMLGSNVLAKQLVLYAKEHGAYTIVADYYAEEKSEAKRVADESVMISTADTEQLGQLIENRKIDAVFAGISEFNLLKAMQLSKEHNLPFYCNLEQWDSIERKDLFRMLCEKNKVPCPKTLFIGTNLEEDEINAFSYPVVVKPVDCSTSKGVYICYTKEELKDHWKESLEDSEHGLIIIEEFVEGDEFTAHYTIANGKASLSCIDNRYPVAVHDGKVTTIPVARIYPSTYIDTYIQNVNPAMLSLCEDLGLQNAVLFIQGLHNKKTGRFSIFEAGLRSAGEAPNRILELVNGIDYMKLLIDHALNQDNVEFDQSKEDPYMKGKCCGVISFIGKHGTVGSIEGLEEAIESTKSVIAYESRYPVGSVVPDTDTLRQIMIRLIMICENREQMAKDVEYLNDHINVRNDHGENMVIKCKPDRIFKEFLE